MILTERDEQRLAGVRPDLETEGRMRTDLSQAEPMPSEIQSFESVRSYAGKLFRINNTGLVSQPPWEYRLF